MEEKLKAFFSKIKSDTNCLYDDNYGIPVAEFINNLNNDENRGIIAGHICAMLQESLNEIDSDSAVEVKAEQDDIYENHIRISISTDNSTIIELLKRIEQD